MTRNCRKISRNEDDGLVKGRRSHAVQQINTREPRHLVVCDDEIERGGEETLPARFAVFRGVHDESLFGQSEFQQIAKVFIVIGDENPRSSVDENGRSR